MAFEESNTSGQFINVVFGDLLCILKASKSRTPSGGSRNILAVTPCV